MFFFTWLYNCVLVWLSKCFEPVKSLCIFRKGCWFPREKERPELFQARLSVYTVHCILYSRKRVIGYLRSADRANLDNKHNLGKVECAQKSFSGWVQLSQPGYNGDRWMCLRKVGSRSGYKEGWFPLFGEISWREQSGRSVRRGRHSRGLGTKRNFWSQIVFWFWPKHGQKRSWRLRTCYSGILDMYNYCFLMCYQTITFAIARRQKNVLHRWSRLCNKFSVLSKNHLTGSF